MNVLRTVVVICLVVHAVCQDVQGDGAGSDNAASVVPSASTELHSTDAQSTKISSPESPSPSNEAVTEPSTGPTNDTSSDIVSSEGTNGEDVTKPAIDTSADIVITSPTVVTDENTRDGTEKSSSTVVTEKDSGTTAELTTAGDEETACSSDPCRNGGTCIDDASNPFLFTCVCPAGYVGIRCGTTDKCVEDQDGQLCKNGACVYSKDGLLRYCRCFIGTGTYWDEETKECRKAEPPCFPNPCLNGGNCLFDEHKQHCDCSSGFEGNNCSVQNKCGDCAKGNCQLDDKNTTKYCKCNEGFFWNGDKQTCEEKTSPCDSSPCFNGGTCVEISATECNCTCESGYSGKHCEILDMCSTSEDCGHGDCKLSEDKKSRTCHCENGFYLARKSHKCEEITNACQNNPCKNDGICWVLSPTSYNCTCSEGFIGATCDVRDLCKLDGGIAYCNDATCENEFEIGVYHCACKDEEYFQYKSRKCVELDLCPLVQCDATEDCSMGVCNCKNNYKWNNETNKCDPIFCSSNPCPGIGMVCEEGTGSVDYKCSCPGGYAFNGTHCNAASCIFPNLNSCGQICLKKTKNEYKCSCDDQFKLKEDNRTCSYTGNYTCSNKTCDRGFCIQRKGVEVCICPPGFVEVAGKCTDICTSHQLASGICPQDECEAKTEGGFMCKCKGKYVLSKDKSTCMVRNVCQYKEVGWNTCTDKKAECVLDWPKSEGFTCKCGSGQTLIYGYNECQDLCNLEENQRMCSRKKATCALDHEDNAICKCPPYFKENESDGKCSQPAISYLTTLPLDISTYELGSRKQRSLYTNTNVDYRKISKDITVTMQEMFIEFSQVNVLSCRPETGYLLCKIELQFRSDPKSKLKRLETEDVCLTNGNSNKCLLPPSLVMVKDRISVDVKIQPTDPCEDDVRGLICGSETTCTSSLGHKSFNCSCKPGFFGRSKRYPFGNMRSFIEACSDIDECVDGDPCPPNSICANTIGNYTCSCKPGFRSINDASGTYSQKCVEICSPNPCIHGKCSKREDHEFDCKCEAGYRGALCNLQDENFKRARNNSIIVGVVLGGILLITFILMAVYISRLRKRKCLENPGQMYYNPAVEMTDRKRAEGGVINNAFQRE